MENCWGGAKYEWKTICIEKDISGKLLGSDQIRLHEFMVFEKNPFARSMELKKISFGLRVRLVLDNGSMLCLDILKPESHIVHTGLKYVNDKAHQNVKALK